MDEIIYNGTRIYPINMQSGLRWAVETAENKTRREAGERTLGGDTLHKSVEDALTEADAQAEREARRQRIREQLEADVRAQKEVEQARKADNVNGFVSGMTSLQAGKVKAALSKVCRFASSGTMTVRAWIEKHHAAGTLDPRSYETNAVAQMTRTQWNRASAREQAEHERKAKEAGTKTVYTVNGINLGKIAWAYAHYLTERSN